MSLSEAVVANVDEIMESSALFSRNGFHLEPRCRVCRNDQLRKKVNDLLAIGVKLRPGPARTCSGQCRT
jgi:hypothetical protein